MTKLYLIVCILFRFKLRIYTQLHGSESLHAPGRKSFFSDFLHCTHSYQESLVSEWLVMYYIYYTENIFVYLPEVKSWQEWVIMYIWPYWTCTCMYIYDSGIIPVLGNVFVFYSSSSILTISRRVPSLCALCFDYKQRPNLSIFLKWKVGRNEWSSLYMAQLYMYVHLQFRDFFQYFMFLFFIHLLSFWVISRCVPNCVCLMLCIYYKQK